MPQATRTSAASVRPTRARPTSSGKVVDEKKPARTQSKPAAKKTQAKKAPAAKSQTKNAPAKRSRTKKAQTKKTPAKETQVKGTQAKKAPARKRAARPALPVRAGEKSWTASDVAEVRGELDTDRGRLLDEVTAADRELKTLLRDGGDGAGFDQADVGSNVLERDAEMSLANNSREMLIQVEHALARLDDGSYGVCESCGEPIGKLRLMAFPRATLCLSCKQRQERR